MITGRRLRRRRRARGRRRIARGHRGEVRRARVLRAPADHRHLPAAALVRGRVERREGGTVARRPRRTSGTRTGGRGGSPGRAAEDGRRAPPAARAVVVGRARSRVIAGTRDARRGAGSARGGGRGATSRGACDAAATRGAASSESKAESQQSLQRESDAISGAKHVRRFAMNPLKAIRAPSIDSLNKTPPLSRPVVGAPLRLAARPSRASTPRTRQPPGGAAAPPSPFPPPPPTASPRARAPAPRRAPARAPPRRVARNGRDRDHAHGVRHPRRPLPPRERARPPHLQDLARERRASPLPPPHPLDPSPAIRSPPREPDRTHAARRARRGPAANAPDAERRPTRRRR